MMDMGVAKPRAHGHAMIKTEIAFTRAYASFGSGPKSAQPMKVKIEIKITIGTKYAETLSAIR
jgi:hypothetical protein